MNPIKTIRQIDNLFSKQEREWWNLNVDSISTMTISHQAINTPATEYTGIVTLGTLDTDTQVYYQPDGSP